GARGIGDDDVGADAIAHQGRQDVTHLPRQERAVLDPVLARVPHGVGHRGRRDLDAVDPAARARQQEADRAGPGIELHDRLDPAELARRSAATGTSVSTSGAEATMFTIASPVRRPSRTLAKRRSPVPESWS